MLWGRMMVRVPLLVLVSPRANTPIFLLWRVRQTFSVPFFSSKSFHMRPQISPRRSPVISSV